MLLEDRYHSSARALKVSLQLIQNSDDFTAEKLYLNMWMYHIISHRKFQQSSCCIFFFLLSPLGELLEGYLLEFSTSYIYLFSLKKVIRFPCWSHTHPKTQDLLYPYSNSVSFSLLHCLTYNSLSQISKYKRLNFCKLKANQGWEIQKGQSLLTC